MKVTNDNFQKEVKEFDGIVLVDFHAAWCGPCKMMMPIIEELEKEYEAKPGIKLAKVDIDESNEIATEYNVVSIPTLIIFKKGEQVREMIGMQSKEALVTAIEEASK